MIMSVRKGKRLISRLLPLLPSPQAAAVVMAIARNLPALAKKDKQDQVTILGFNQCDTKIQPVLVKAAQVLERSSVQEDL